MDGIRVAWLARQHGLIGDDEWERVCQPGVDLVDALVASGTLTRVDLMMMSELDARLARAPHRVGDEEEATVVGELDGFEASDTLDAEQARYVHGSKLGAGGTGEIWRARDLGLGREVAIKYVRGCHRRGERGAQYTLELLHEAQLTSSLEHPGILPVYDLGEDEEQGLYYTMRALDAPTLGALMDAHRGGDVDAPTTRKLLEVVLSALRTLGYAHERGVIHRDVKPENILVDAQGEVFVIDWGLAVGEMHGLVEDSSVLDRIEDVELRGTPGYMSPEQARGHDHLIDARTDVWAMGVVIWEILSRARLFDSDYSYDVLERVRRAEVVAPSQLSNPIMVDERLEALVMKALAPRRGHRWTSASAMAEALEAYLDEAPTLEHRIAAARKATREGREHQNQWLRLGERAEVVALSASVLRAQLEAGASHARRQDLWALEQGLRDAEFERGRALVSALKSYSKALESTCDYAPARAALAEIYWARLQEAERRCDAAGVLEFSQLVRRYGDGTYTELLGGKATLTVRVTPHDATVRVYACHPEYPILQDKFIPITPDDAAITLDHGAYVVELSAPGRRAQRVPVILSRLAHERVEVELVHEHTLPADAIVVEGGSFMSGAPAARRAAGVVHELGRFAMMERPVTCRDYVTFLNDLLARGREDEAHARVPRYGYVYAPCFPLVDGQYVVPDPSLGGQVWEDDAPVRRLNYSDALAYARWRAERDHIPWRLPTALEWEKAARGVDGRIYPWGNDFEVGLSNTRGSRPGGSGPVAVGTHPHDLSPYGVFDMAGNVTCWTRTMVSDGVRVVCGASYASAPAEAPVYTHTNASEGSRHGTCGVRLVVEL